MEQPSGAAASRKRRLIVVAENSLIVQSIQLGLRSDGAFDVLERVEADNTSIRGIVHARPDAILLEDFPVCIGSLPTSRRRSRPSRCLL